MGVGEKFKDIYYIGEEKWYHFWDKIDSHIPIYKIIDPIDSVIPSFALFLIIIFILLLLVCYSLFGLITTTEAILKLTIVDAGGSPVSDAKVTLSGTNNEYYSNEYGLIEDIKTQFMTTIEITAEKDGKKTILPVLIDNDEKIVQIQLPIKKASFAQKTLRFVESGNPNETTTGELTLSYSCSTGNDSAAPQGGKIYNSALTIAVSEDCGTLSVEVTSPNYETKNFTLTSASNTIPLKQKAPIEKTTITAQLKYNGQLLQAGEQILVQVYKGSSALIPIDSAQTVAGQVQFVLPEGDYRFKSVMEKGYKEAITPIITITKSTTTPVIINLEKNYVGFIKVQTKEGGAILKDVHVYLSKKNPSTGILTQVRAKDTNETGEVTFELAETGLYVVTATKDYYCDKTVDANAGESIILNMQRATSTCASKLKIKVIDQTGKPVAYAKAALFGKKGEDTYQLPYPEIITDYNGNASWQSIRSTTAGETFKVFAFKSTYSGWSDEKEFSSLTAIEPFNVTLTVPSGTVKVTVKNNDNEPVQFAQVQLFDEYLGDEASGKRLIENTDGSIEFTIKADKKVYAVIKKEGYESYTTLPQQVIGEGTITINAVLSKPPIRQLAVNPIGIYKNGASVLKVEPNQEYDAVFEIIAPKAYDELGFFVRAGAENITKTELDKLFIKSINAPAKKTSLFGSTYNKPKGYNIDSQYTNLEESKWAQIKWQQSGYEPGKIIVSAKIKIRPNAQQDETLELWFRAWGVLEGAYERDLADSEISTSQNSTTKQELYALAKPIYLSVGTETLCDSPAQERAFCVTTTYTDLTDPRLIVNSFDGSFDAKNNTPYSVTIKVMNDSKVGFDNAITSLENPEENLFINSYLLLTPRAIPLENTALNAYKTGLMDTPFFVKKSTIDFRAIKIIPNKTSTGTLTLKISDNRAKVFEKTITINIASDKKMNAKYMKGNEFSEEMPDLVSGKLETLTIKAYNTQNNLEIENAIVKIYDRFGTKLLEKTTNKLGLATIIIPASFPGEKLKLQIEKPEYETYLKEFKIAENVITVTPTELAFTVNPQNKPQDTKTIKITNNTGLDLTIKEIKLTGKLKGLLNTSQIESWFNTYKGKTIKTQDYEEIDFKVISAPEIPSAADLEGEFEITVGAEGKEWVKTINTKIRVGLGKDVDNPSCLEITQTNWQANTQGGQAETSFTIKNNCLVDGKPVALKYLSASINTQENTFGSIQVQSATNMIELGTNYSRVFRTIIDAEEKIPVTVRFTPYGGANGTATGTIKFEAQNQTDSTSQKVTAELKYNINVEDVKQCIVLGADLVTITSGGTGSFSITNNCKTTADIQLEKDSLQVSNDRLTLQPGQGKDITITRNQGDIPGAYNILIYGRKANTKLELIGNVKTILESEGCFSLSRYEYDVYDSPLNTFDGIDRGYLRNNCVEKNTTAKITGKIPFDMKQMTKMMLWGALMGWIGSYANKDKDKTEPFGWAKPQKTESHLELYALRVQKDKDYYLGLECTQTQKQIDYAYGLKKIELGALLQRATKNRVQLETQQKTINTLLSQTGLPKECRTELENQKESIKVALVDAENNEESFVAAVKQLEQKNAAQASAFSNECKQLYSKYEPEFKEVLLKIKTQNLKQTTAEKEHIKILEKIKATLEETKITYLEKANEYKLLEEKQGPEFQITLCALSDKDKQEVGILRGEIKALKEDLGSVSAEYERGIKNAQEEARKELDEKIKEVEKLKKSAGETATKNLALEKTVADLSKTIEQRDAKLLELEKEKEKEIRVRKQKLMDLEEEAAMVQDWEAFLSIPRVPSREETAVSALRALTGLELVLSPLLIHSKDSFEFVPSLTRGIVPSEIELLHILSNSRASLESGAAGNTITENKKYSLKLEGGSSIKYIGRAMFSFIRADKGYKYLGIPGGAFHPLALNIWQFEKVKGYNAMTTIGEDGTYYAVIEINRQDYLFTKKVGNDWECEIGNTKYTITQIEKEKHLVGRPLFLLQGVSSTNNPPAQTSTTNATGKFILYNSPSQVNADTSNQAVLGNALMQSIGPLMAGAQFDSWWKGTLAGALTNGLLIFMTGQDKIIDVSDTFIVPLVEIDKGGVKLTSPDGIAMSVGEKTYDYESYAGGTINPSTTSGTTTGTGTTTTPTSAYTGNVLYNPQALSATIGKTEMYELEFTNPSKARNKTINQPFPAQLIVTGTEKVYDTEYKYDYVKKQAKARGELEKKDNSALDKIKDFFRPINSSTEEIAQMNEKDLKVKETRTYEKKFRLLFYSFEALDCGPSTYPCPQIKLSNCEVEGKTGVTGEEGVPRIKLSWMWGSGNEISRNTAGIGIQACDSDYNPNYHYCDSVQLTIEVMKKLLWMKEFFKANSLPNCPTGGDYLTAETQKLNANSLDVGVTSINVTPMSGGGAKLTATVETNNNQDIKTKVKFKFTDDSGTEIRNVCAEEEKTFRSAMNYECVVDTTILGQGKFNVEASLNGLVLCSSGCENNDTANDMIKSLVAVGTASTAQSCKEFKTNREYFEKVLSANGLLSNENGKKMLEYISFKANLVRDAVSEDFKDDLDAYLSAVAQAPPEYASSGLRELFLSNKYQVEWPTKPDAWKAGKYDAELLVKFKENNWKWDNNNIESITLKLSPQGKPDPIASGNPIYNVAFDGMVGLNSDNGRQGYGAGFEQLTEDVFLIAKDGSANILAQKNAKSNPITVVNLGVKKGTEAFTLLNSSPTRGSVLNVSGTTNVELILTPSIAVPVILTIDDSEPFATDAYAFYSAEVNGQPQETGSAFMIWNGIGQGCVDFTGGSMMNYFNQYDAKASTYTTGYDKAYGWYWPMITHPGKVSMYSSFFAPQGAQTLLKIIGQSKTAVFESTSGTGDISVSTTGTGIKNLQDVFNLVKANKVCVIGGEYYWNNNGLREELIQQINAKAETCIPSRQ